MRTFILLIALTIFSPTSKAEDRFSFSANDKQAHMLGSYGLAFTGTAVLKRHTKMSRLEAVLWSSAATFALGTIKETLIDKTFSSSDMLANTIGVATSAMVVITFDLFPDQRVKNSF